MLVLNGALAGPKQLPEKAPAIENVPYPLARLLSSKEDAPFGRRGETDRERDDPRDDRIFRFEGEPDRAPRHQKCATFALTCETHE